MTKQINLFYNDPDLVAVTDKIVAARTHAEGMAIALNQNIVRAAGGGEPRDHGTVVGTHGDVITIAGVEKHAGLTWLVLPRQPGDISVGAPIKVSLDRAHRERKRRLHTGVHLCIRTALNQLGPLRVTAANIDEEARSAMIRAELARSVTSEDVPAVDMAMRSIVLEGRAVTTAKAKSLDEAESRCPELFRVSDRHAFKGRVRLIQIEDFDLNPCSGLHQQTTDIGCYALRPDPDGHDETEFAVELRLTDTWTYWFGDA